MNKFDLDKLVETSRGFSGAEIEQAIISAMFDAFHAKRDLLTEDVVQALTETVSLSVTMREQIENLRNWASKRAKNTSETVPESGTSIDSTGSFPSGPAGKSAPKKAPGGLNLFSDLGD